MVFLIIIIYITFISLGLPDSLFGVSWPVMHLDLGLAESYGSFFTIIVGIGAGNSSFISGALVRKTSTGVITSVSVLLTAIGLLGYSLSSNILTLIISSILLGFGAGAVDSVLNNFVSLHYKAIHMNWLHCFWGIGVTLSPLIMSYYLTDNQWRSGYKAVSLIIFIISALLFITLPLWKKAKDSPLTSDQQITKEGEKYSFKEIIKIKGVIIAILSVGLYCSMEFIIGTWGASYLVNTAGITAESAAKIISTFYLGIMAGRFLSGILSLKVCDKHLIRSGILISMAGIIILALPLGNISFIGFSLIGLGFAPFFPSTLHATSIRFGKKYSQDITGFQMGGGYAIAWLIQITFGNIASATTFAFMPLLFIAINILLLITTERINKVTK